MPISEFIHLRVHSQYSLLEGAIRISDFTDLCEKYNMPAVAITDSGNLFGSLEFAKACSGKGIQPIIGCIVNIAREKKDDDNQLLSGKPKNIANEHNSGSLVLLVQNEIGYLNLLNLVSDSFLKGEDCHHPIIEIESFNGKSEGIIALTGGADGIIGKDIQEGNLTKAESTLLELNKLFKNRLYIELHRLSAVNEQVTEKPLIDLAYKHNLPLVATNDVHFRLKDMHEAHDALVCIADGAYVSMTDRKTFTPEHYFKSPKEMVELFSDIPEATANSLVIAKRCSYMPEPHAPMLPHFPTEEGRTEDDELRAIARAGLKKRLDKHVFTNDMDKVTKATKEKEYFDRLDFELDVIIGMEFPGYFLIVSDFIRWSKANDIPVGPGRGSGAGSVVAWSLEITDLDPLRFGLLFERFLNPERVSMPDFDIDFCQERRDEVITYVKDKYGAERVAQIITFGKLQARAVLRDVGRVLQMSYGHVDKICKMIPFNALEPVTLSQAVEMDANLRKEQKSDEQVAKLIDIGLKLEGLYRHASTHAAGVVIGSRNLVEILPLYTDHKSEIPTTQYSMKYAEMIGLVKFDFLGLKTLTTIFKACKLIKQRGVDINIEDDVAYDDPATFKMLSEGNSTGVFQMESAGMRDALRKMKPDNIEDIIALISLYRPGPMENIPTYIARKHGKEEPDYLHPKLEKCLKETFGVIIYQEQVMQIAQILAGYSLGGADLLRRAMGKKIKSEMDSQRVMFEEGAVKNGVDKDQASSIFDLVAKFAGYGFNKSHAAAYAVIGYQTAYLKANYPVEFLAASMNIDIGDTDKLSIFCEEAKKSKIEIFPPDINKSGASFTVELENGKAGIRYGLAALKNVGLAAMEDLEKKRSKNGEYKDIFDFAVRSDNKIMNKRQLENLIKAGAFDKLDKNRKKLAESVGALSKYSQQIAEEKASQQISLFGNEEELASPEGLLVKINDWSKEEKITHEFNAIGFYLSTHPLSSHEASLRKLGIVFANELESRLSGEGGKKKIAGVVTKTIHRSSNGRRFAYLYISDPTGNLEISIFDEKLLSNSRDLIDGSAPIIIRANIRKDEGGIRILAESIELLSDALNKINYKVEIYLKNEITNCDDFATELFTTISQTKQNNSASPMTAEIKVFIPTNNNMNVEISLPKKHSLTSNKIDSISNIIGIKKVYAN